MNARLDTLQAAILLAKLEVFSDELIQRRRAAARYSEGLAGVPGIETPTLPGGAQSAIAQYSILTDDRTELQKALESSGVPTAVYYPRPLHLQTAFTGLGYKPGDFPVSEEVSRRILSLPMHPYLSDADIDPICQAVSDCRRNPLHGR